MTVECDQLHPGIPVRDVPAAVAYYVNKLGFEVSFTFGDPPTFAGMKFGNVEIFLQQGTPTPGPDSSAVYFHVGDVDKVYEFHRANGVEIAEPIDDRHYSMRDYAIRDLNGYYLTFGQHLLNDGPPLKIERVDVPVRLEKRLAALLEDLAKHKRMTIGSCLEEMILHTNDGVGPHTKTTLRYIQELKQKHAIDYDTHGSYRFNEE